MRLAAALLALLAADGSAATLRFLKKVRVGVWPKALALSPDGERALVAVHHGEALAVVERKTLKVVRKVPLGGRPEGVAMSRDGKRLYVTLGDRGLLEVRDGTTYELVRSIPVGAQPRGVTLAPDGAWAFVAAAKAGKLAIVDTAALRVRAEIDVGWSPRAVAVAGPDRVLVVHALGHSLYVVDPRKGEILHKLRGFGRRPLDVAVSPDGADAFVPSKDRVFRVALTGAPKLAESWPIGKRPTAVALSRSGKTLFTALWEENKIAFLSTTRGRGRRVVRTGKAPIALAVSPSGKTLWAACFKSHDVWVYAIR